MSRTRTEAEVDSDLVKSNWWGGKGEGLREMSERISVTARRSPTRQNWCS